MEDNDTPEPFVGSFFKYLFGLLLIGVVITQTPLGGILSNASADVYISTISLLRTDTTVPTLDDGLVGHYTFDGNYMDLLSTTAEVRDRSSYGNHGDWKNHSTTTVAGVMGQAIEFAGVDDEIIIPDSDSLSFTSGGGNDLPFSVGGWVKHENVGVGFYLPQILVKTNKETSYEWGLDYNTSRQLTVRAFDSSLDWIGRKHSVNTVALYNNQWVHVFATYDGSNAASGFKLFINGVRVDDSDENSGTYNGMSNLVTNVSISSDLSSANIQGSVDDLRIYNRELSPDEVDRLYQLGAGNKVAATPSPTDNLSSGLVGHWTFDGNNINWGDTGSEIKDRSGQDNHGNAISVNPSSAIIGKLGQALEFDGVGDNVNFGNLTIIDGATAASICTWINYGPSTVSADSGLVTKWNSEGYLLWVDDAAFISGRSNTVSFAVDASASGPGRIEGSTNLVEPSVWSHYCGTFSGGNFIRLYKDGVLNQENTSSVVASVPIQSNNLKIADSDHASNIKYFPGKIDDVRIYNRALTSAEVAQLYRQGGGVTARPCGAFTVFDADNNEYGTVQIGNQCWMAENMRVGTRINAVTAQSDNGIIEKYCYANTDSNCTTNNPNNPDGGLYQWNEAMQYSTKEGAQGICPAGWHIPTDQEFKDLEIFLGMTRAQADTAALRGADQGTQLEANGSSGWEGNLAGFRTTGTFGAFLDRGDLGAWWSSSPSGSDAWTRAIGFTQVSRSQENQGLSLSIRCLKD